jgi:hypothetical protein
MKEAIGRGAAGIVLAVGLAAMPLVAHAQASPAASPSVGASPGANTTTTTTTTTTATSSPAAATTTTGAATTTTGGGSSGWWGLIGLVGLLGLFGMGGRRQTNVETYDTTRR